MVMSFGTTGMRLSEEKCKRRPKGVFTLLFLVGLLGACAPMSKNVVKEEANHAAIQNATTLSDHYALAKRFEDAANEMRTNGQSPPTCQFGRMLRVHCCLVAGQMVRVLLPANWTNVQSPLLSCCWTGEQSPSTC